MRYRELPVRLASLLVLVSAALLCLPSGASAAAPKWHLSTFAPDSINAGRTFVVDVSVENTGSVPLAGPLTIADTFPAGVTPVEPSKISGTAFGSSCSISEQTTTCVVNEDGMAPGARVWLRFLPMAGVISGNVSNVVTVAGGGVAGGSTSEETMTVAAQEPFAVKTWGVGLLDENEQPTTQAGAAPYQALSTLRFRTETSPVIGEDVTPAERLKDTVVHLPPGMVGNTTATLERCTSTELSEEAPGLFTTPDCPQDSQVGVVHVVSEQKYFGPQILPLYNMVPRVGVPAEFGFNFAALTVGIAARLRPSDNGIDLTAVKAPSSLAISEVDVTFWGTPASGLHDYQRHACLQSNYEGNYHGDRCRTEAPLKAFLRTPTSCSGPLHWSAEVDSYTHPGSFVSAESTSPGMTGCERLPFEPSFSLTPAHLTPETPTGLDATVTLPQETAPEGLATADLKNATVALPAGVSLNPSSAGGLQACGDAELKLGVEGAATCPEASKIGTVALTTPLIDHPLSGSIFLRPQESMDPASGKLFRIAVEIRSDDDGIDIKLPASIKVDPTTGQLTTVFENQPQLPFSSFTLHFKDGPRAALTTPSGCGSFTTTASFDSWSGKTVSTSSSFQVSGCGARGFAPGFKAGTVNPVANSYSPFVLQLTRSDADQQLGSLSPLYMPAGLLANIGSVPRCSDAQVAAQACPDSSRLGNLTVGAGAGPNPFYVTDGNVFLTGPYKGAPFGLAFVVHAKAGPFDLGTVVVRAALRIDPTTAQPVIESDPFPTILAGVPLRLRDIRVSIDRPHFMFNPTSCDPMSINGTVVSTANQVAGVSSRFQVGECANLAFKPKFSASTTGKTSKANGVSFRVHLASNEGPHNTSSAGESNIAKVDVQLPISLPARLTTLQKACTEAQFASNPAGCPAASFVGTAVARTPILASPLSGPAILVSHGGQAFPDLVLVLQGEGVRLNITGHTQIKKGITFSHFDTVPDAPVASFDLTLPQGPHSALTTDVPGRNLCTNTRTVTVTKRVTRRVHGHTRKVTVKAKKAVAAALLMPTTLTAQNGAVNHQNTKIAVTGCVKAKAVKHAAKGKK